MKQLVLLILICSYATLGFAQDSISLRTTRVIKTYPLIILDRLEYNLSYEQTIGKRYSMEIIGSYVTLEGSYSKLIFSMSQYPPPLIPAKGFSLECGVKRFLKQNNSPFGFFNSISIMYKYESMNNFQDVYGDYSSYRNMDRVRKAYTLKCFFGWQHKIFYNHFLIGIYSGIGIRKIIDVDKINWYYHVDFQSSLPQTIYYDNNYEQHINYTPVFNLGLNIGYLF